MKNVLNFLLLVTLVTSCLGQTVMNVTVQDHLNPDPGDSCLTPGTVAAVWGKIQLNNVASTDSFEFLLYVNDTSGYPLDSNYFLSASNTNPSNFDTFYTPLAGYFVTGNLQNGVMGGGFSFIAPPQSGCLTIIGWGKVYTAIDTPQVLVVWDYCLCAPLVWPEEDKTSLEDPEGNQGGVVITNHTIQVPDDTEVMLFNMEGKKVRHQIGSGLINLLGLTSGVYHGNIVSGGGDTWESFTLGL